MLTPSYAAYLIEWAAGRNVDLRGSSVERVLVAGEPGGGEPAFRAKLEEGWGARVTEGLGNGDMARRSGEARGNGRDAPGAGAFVHAELVDPDSGRRQMADGATGELASGSHLQHRAAPLLRFRTRDHVQALGRARQTGGTSPRLRCVGRTDDMLIVRGVNVFPSAVREGREHVRAPGQRPHPRQAASAGREAGSAASRQRRACPRRNRGCRAR